MPEIHTLTVAEVVTETPDAHSVVFELTPEQAEAFRYRPGQFLTLKVGTAARCYSLSSAPHEGSRLKVTVKRTDGGYGSNWICDNIRAGARVEVLAPAGVFTPKDLDENLLLFAGGSGITPVMSILKTALRQGNGRITLLYANRDERSVIFAGELAALSREFAGRLTVLHWLESVQGLPTVEQLRTLAQPFAEFEAFLCGPAPFMAAAKQALKDFGLPKNRIHLEKFVSLGGDPFATQAPAPESGETTALRVDLDGTQHEFTWPRQRKLLDFLLDKGLDAPYSCREGQCSACACRIVSGEVKMLDNEILDSEDIADGIVLACQSVPLTDAVSVTYE
ncbi:ferredoxin--NADP reductase [Amycolatopsis acidiphila]|uniref:Ferredoxin--NADP reductase n=1 Tax=Amycolatopsis acidiphila TaxID=715473 RepID=A0A558AEW9_9PSEU|nr:ferredoxin--NADP reductase [Amycolatopsis acidiphila]TVT22809.1 ferredoxin--NADP reductase [Amycolatopsis acidiphila]UIJ58178.1 ferredoxin--NADP reductase [Amycolatopsis acidiphila]GHG69606.1 oxidoreductase [Amycolatopsis acidiphila]